MITTITQNGVGTELKKVFRKLGIRITPECLCELRATRMDQMGSQWCLQNIELIIDWLEDEAERQAMLFVRLAAKLLVKRAIRKARKQEQANGVGVWNHNDSPAT